VDYDGIIYSMERKDFDMRLFRRNTPRVTPSVHANPLIQASPPETFLNCINHLMSVVIELHDKSDGDANLLLLAKQIEMSQRELFTVQWPPSKDSKAIIKQQMRLLAMYNDSLKETTENGYSYIVNNVVMAIESELHTLP